MLLKCRFRAVCLGSRRKLILPIKFETTFNSPLKKASLTGFHATAKHIAAKAVSPSSETMRTI